MAERKKRKYHRPEQVVKKLAQADRLLKAGRDLGEVLQILEISEASYHRWRKQYGGMEATEAKRLKELELENARLKKLVAEAALDRDILKSYIDELGKG